MIPSVEIVPGRHLRCKGVSSAHRGNAWRSSPEPEHSVRGGAKAGAIDRGLVSPGVIAGWHSMQAMPQQAPIPMNDEQVLC